MLTSQSSNRKDAGGNLRLRDRRRRLGRQRAGQPPQRGRHRDRARAGGRPQRLASLHPSPGRLHQDVLQQACELALQHGAQRVDRRAAHPRPARQDARRLQLHQRPRLQPRPAHGLRHLGAARQPRLGLRRRAPLLQAHGAAAQRWRDEPDLPRPRRRPHRHRHRLVPSALRGLHRRRRQPRHPAQPRLQRHHPGRHRLRPAHHPQGPPRQRRHVVPAPRPQARECHGAHGGPRHGTAVRGQARRRRRLQHWRPWRRAHDRARCARGHPVGRHLQFAAAAAALRHRPAGDAAEARHCGSPRAGRRRREPARSLRAALHRTRQEHRHHQRARARPAARRRSPALGDDAQRHPRARPHAHLLLLALPSRTSPTRTCNSPSRRPATRKACRASSTPSPA